jgi:thiamine pyrophosphokinase
MHVLIFANGDLRESECTDNVDLVLCADGGTRHARMLGMWPDVVIGDLDSLSQGEREMLEAHGVQIAVHPRAKDETDLELALLYAAGQGARRITVLGVRGGRLDHELGNLMLLAHPDLREIDVRFRAGSQEAVLVAREKVLSGSPGDLLSLLPIGGDAHGITTCGLEYVLEDETLYLGRTRGISNVFNDSSATIRVRSGLLLALHTHQDEAASDAA